MHFDICPSIHVDFPYLSFWVPISFPWVPFSSLYHKKLAPYSYAHRSLKVFETVRTDGSIDCSLSENQKPLSESHHLLLSKYASTWCVLFAQIVTTTTVPALTLPPYTLGLPTQQSLSASPTPPITVQQTLCPILLS